MQELHEETVRWADAEKVKIEVAHMADVVKGLPESAILNDLRAAVSAVEQFVQVLDRGIIVLLQLRPTLRS
jgi:hypothetical protein